MESRPLSRGLWIRLLHPLRAHLITLGRAAVFPAFLHLILRRDTQHVAETTH